MGMLTEIPWEHLLLPPKPTLPPFRELHPEPPGKENEAGLYKPRPFDPERNDYGSAKLIPWRNCARARQWIKKRYNRKFWYYDMEHVKWKTLCENFERELKRMHREPNFVEIKQLEKYQKKTEKAAELLMEEALKAVVRMKEEEAERKRQEEEQEEQERRKYQYTLLSASELWGRAFHSLFSTVYFRSKGGNETTPPGIFKHPKTHKTTVFESDSRPLEEFPDGQSHGQLQRGNATGCTADADENQGGIILF